MIEMHCHVRGSPEIIRRKIPGARLGSGLAIGLAFVYRVLDEQHIYDPICRRYWPVSKRVNNPKNLGAEFLATVG